MAYLLEKPVVAMRAEDVLAAADFARQLAEGAPLHLVSIGHVGIPALHAAALEPARFASVRIEDCLISWTNTVELGIIRNQLHNVVHGALHWYDLPDLARLAGENTTVVSPVDAMGRPMDIPRDM
jgi:hypothetical protein